MTQVQPERARGADALSQPFTPGAPSNPPELADYPETLAGPLPAPRQDPKTAAFVEQWRNTSYNCYSSGHKFCREVCPVTQVTRNESWTPTAFHADVVAMDRGEMTIEDVAADYVNCTQCGACEVRCPNTLFTGDFYRFRTRTVVSPTTGSCRRRSVRPFQIFQFGWWPRLSTARELTDLTMATVRARNR